MVEERWLPARKVPAQLVAGDALLQLTGLELQARELEPKACRRRRRRATLIAMNPFTSLRSSRKLFLVASVVWLGLRITQPVFAATRSLRNGESPSGDPGTLLYTGTKDVYINHWGWSLANQNGDGWDLEADADTPTAALLRFDVSAIPIDAVVTSAVLDLYVVNGSVDSFQLHALNKNFVEGEATWVNRKVGSPWIIQGASDPGIDYATPIMGTTPPTASGSSASVPFSIEGVLALQGWVSAGFTNWGFVIRADNPNATDGLLVRDSETPLKGQRPLLRVNFNLSSGGSAIADFQQGLSPSAAYAGVSDVVISAGTMSSNDGQGLTLGGGGGDDASTLIQFDLSPIPTGVTLSGASLVFWVTDQSIRSYPVYRVLAPWNEQAYTGTPDGINAWAAPGATGALDHDTLSLGVVGPAAFGSLTVPLNSAGLSVVQRWLDGTDPNHGFILQNYLATDRLDLRDSETATIVQRPALVLNYPYPSIRLSVPTAPLGQLMRGVTTTLQVERLDASGAPDPVGAEQILLISDSSDGRLSGLGANWNTSFSLAFANGESTKSVLFQDTINQALKITASSSSRESTQLALEILDDTFKDDFEGPDLLWTATPPGPWHHLEQPDPASGLMLEPEAVHGGNQVLQLLDADAPASGAGSTAYLDANLVSTASRYFLRVWVKLLSTNSIGDLALLGLYRPSTTTSPSPLMDAWLDAKAGTLKLRAANGPAMVVLSLTSYALAPGGWHLLELGAKGLGSSAGEAQLYVDGTQVASLPGLDFSNFEAQRIALGSLASIGAGAGRSFGGMIEFDNLQGAPTLPADRLALERLGTGIVSEGQCEALQLLLIDAEAGEVPTTAAVPVTLDTDTGAGSFYSDFGCATPVTTANLDAATPRPQLYFKPSGSGSVSLYADSPDLLRGSLPLDVQAVTQVLDPAMPVTLTGAATAEACASGGESLGLSLEALALGGSPLPAGRLVQVMEDPPHIVFMGSTESLDPATAAPSYELRVGSDRCDPLGVDLDIQVDGVTLDTHPHLVFTCPAVESTGIDLLAIPSLLPADGVAESTLTLTLLDRCGNPAFGRDYNALLSGALEEQLQGTTGAALGAADDGRDPFSLSASVAGEVSATIVVEGQATRSFPSILSFESTGKLRLLLTGGPAQVVPGQSMMLQLEVENLNDQPLQGSQLQVQGRNLRVVRVGDRLVTGSPPRVPLLGPGEALDPGTRLNFPISVLVRPGASIASLAFEGHLPRVGGAEEILGVSNTELFRVQDSLSPSGCSCQSSSRASSAALCLLLGLPLLWRRQRAR